MCRAVTALDDAIGQISSIKITAAGTYNGATGGGVMSLSTSYLGAAGVGAAWVGSLFGHEGQHYSNMGNASFLGDNQWKNEQSAGRTQLSIGQSIGMAPNQLQYLTNYTQDSNKVQMQEHMVNGQR